MSAEVLAALAQAGGVAVVQAAGTEAWTAFRNRVARLFGRGDERREQAESARLDHSAAAIGRADDAELVRQEASWRARFEMLLEGLDGVELEQATAELRALVEEFGRSEGRGNVVGGNTFHGPAAFQAGSGNRQVNHFGSQA